jgi:hypothetical protein
VRTTVILDDALLRRAKAEAARRGLTLSALIERALRDELRQSTAAREPSTQYRVPTFGPDETNHAHEPRNLSDALLEEDGISLRRPGRRS